MPGDGKNVVRQKLYIPNDTNGGFEQSRPPFFYSLKIMQLCFQTWRPMGITAMKHKACRQIPTRSISKNTSAAEYHISKRESYHVAKVNIFQTSIRYACVFTGVFFIGNTTKNHETTKPLGRKQESSRPACAAFGIRKKRKEQKNCFFPGIS